MKIISSHARNRALTRVELLVVIVVIAAFAVFFAMQPDRNAKARALRIQCINNLKQIGLAFDSWAGDHGEKFPMELSQTNGGTMEFATGPNEWRHFQVMSNELPLPKVFLCPSDSRSIPATNFVFMNNSNLSFFVNLDYSRPNPGTLWSGDRNIANGTPINDGILQVTTNHPSGWTAEMHNRVGNILLFDGSVRQVSSFGLRAAIENSGSSTNRWQMPILFP